MNPPPDPDAIAATLRPDFVGAADPKGAGEVRRSDRYAVLIATRTHWVALWLYDAEASTWSKGVRSLKWWDETAPADLPSDVPHPGSMKHA